MDDRLDRLCAGQDRLIIALSGGSDSLALACLAADWARRKTIGIRAAIIDHALTEGSAARAQAAKAHAESLGLDADIHVWAGAKPATGLQAAARQARYRLLAGAARSFGATAVLTGHTLDDQAETVWMRAGRGGHWRTLAAMDDAAPYPVWPDGLGLTLLRPLLGTTRAELRAHLRAAGAGWIDDPANEDLTFERVRARSRLAQLKAARDWRQRLKRLARQGRACARAEDDAARRTLEAAIFNPTGDVRLEGAPGPRALQVLIAAVSGAAHPPSREVCERLADALATGAKTATLGGAILWREAGALRVAREPAEVLGRADNQNSGIDTIALGDGVVWDGRIWVSGLRDGDAIAPLSAMAEQTQDAARSAYDRTPERVRDTLPVIVRGGELAAAPFLGYNSGLYTMSSLSRHRAFALLGGPETAWPGGGKGQDAPH